MAFLWTSIPRAAFHDWQNSKQDKKNYCPFYDTHNNCSIVRENLVLSNESTITTVFVDMRLWKKQDTHGDVSKISVNHTHYPQIGSKSTNHSPWCDLLYVMLAGCNWLISIRFIHYVFDCDNFGNVSADVLFSKVAYQQKRWQKVKLALWTIWRANHPKLSRW